MIHLLYKSIQTVIGCRNRVIKQVGVIITVKEKCQTCYSCVRNCPVKAIKVEDGQAIIVDERCISCGNCVRVCAQNAKKIDDLDLNSVRSFLKTRPTVAMLAPSFPAAFPGVEPQELFSALLELGFVAVEEVAVGVALTVPYYKEYLHAHRGTVIASYCPAVVELIQRHYPTLIPMLAPIDSAVMATAKYLRKKNKCAHIVFIGPCMAKKEESRSDERNLVNAVLTFRELNSLFAEIGFNVTRIDGTGSGAQQELARIFPVSGGLLKNLGLGDEIVPELSVVEGKDDCVEVIKNLSEGKISPRFLDILFCKGCVDGPEIDSEIDLFSRKMMVLDYAKSYQDEVPQDFPAIDLSRNFFDHSVKLPMPSENEIKDILKHTFKTKPEDELNCGACGYETCREKAVAVYQGLAEIDMCLPYLLAKSRGEIEYYRDRLNMPKASKYILEAMIGDSAEIQSLKKLMEKAAASSSTMLIQGESGVGKEIVAQVIHNLSPQSKKPYIAINCAAVPELLLESELFGYEEGAFTGARKGGKLGKFEMANGGTLLLDEIGDLPLTMQSKLLRVIQEREFERLGGNRVIKVDVRIIAATNKDLRGLVAEGKFRIDLFYRLNVLPINVPPLRERKQDIPLLIGHFIEKICREKNITPKIVSSETIGLLLKYSWPGNVRELENIVERTMFLAEGYVVKPEALPPHIQSLGYSGEGREFKLIKDAVREVEKQLIVEAMQRAKGNKVMASKLLGITRVTLYQKLKEYNLLTKNG